MLRIRTAPLLVNGRLEGHVGTVADITQESAAENAMRLLAAIFEATTDYVVQADARGRITYMNAAARRISGLGADEAIAHRDFSDFNTPETNELFARVIVPAVKANGIWVGDTTVYNHERNAIPVSHMVLAHRDKSGRIEHYSAVMRDISAQVSDQRSLQRQAATLALGDRGDPGDGRGRRHRRSLPLRQQRVRALVRRPPRQHHRPFIDGGAGPPGVRAQPARGSSA